MILNYQEEYDFDDVLLLPQLTSPDKMLDSRSSVTLHRIFENRANTSRALDGTPIIAANMDTVGTFKMAAELGSHGCYTAIHKHYPVEELISFFKNSEEISSKLFYTMGINDVDVDKFNAFVKGYGIPDNICIDVANGYMPRFHEFVSKIKNTYPDITVMAGNVVTPDAVYALIKAGAAIVKIGIGSGSACTTRLLTGVGRPQFSAVVDCANAAHGLNGMVCSDGGCAIPAHASKAFGGGADFVMLGGMLAGHYESEGEIIYKNVENRSGTVPTTTQVPDKMLFYGMSSKTAMDKHSGGMANYRSSEGRTLAIPYRGNVSNTLENIMGGVRSTMLYIGAKQMKEIAKCAKFVPVRRQLNTSLAQHEITT